MKKPNRKLSWDNVIEVIEIFAKYAPENPLCINVPDPMNLEIEDLKRLHALGVYNPSKKSGYNSIDLNLRPSIK